MKQLFSVVGLFLIGMSFCCTPHHKSPAEVKKELVNRLEKETVALVSIDEQRARSYCAGVWISEKKILTARHCVDDNQFVFYVNLGDPTPRLAMVKSLEENDDLALLEALGDTPSHPYATVANDVWDGEHVNIVGHPIGMVWTYMDGVVSSTRTDIMTETTRMTLQVASPVWMGNSGGGAFDDEGRLLGICSFVSRKAPLMSFFTHPAAINSFLSKKDEASETVSTP